MAHTITRVHGREILDSRGNPTVEVEVGLSDGSLGRAMVPSGASKGQHEALEMRDEDPKRYQGKGTLKAVANVNESLAKALTGKAFDQIQDVDKAMLELDGTPQKAKLGANAILGVSLAFAQALAAAQKRPLFIVLNEMMGVPAAEMKLPIPLMNIINGGLHANNGLEVQEFMIVPHGFGTFSEALRAGCEVFHTLKKNLAARKLSTAVGDEGGFAPALKFNENALECICDAITGAGYELGKNISLAMDVAASSFFAEATGKYALSYGDNEQIDANELMDYYQRLFENFPIVSVEDPLQEADWSGWRVFTEKFGKQLQVVGDDIFVTQAKWVRRGIDEKCANAVLIKVNQVGTLTETFESMTLCRQNGYSAVVSHRSGETEDVTIAHLAVGSGCGQIKTGSASRSERMAKYNELLRIEEWGRLNGRALPFARRFG